MKRFVREYGLVVVIVTVGMVGYATFYENKQEVLTSSLDIISDRLVAMIDDVSGREAIARHFDRFQEKVLAQEVPSDEVANMAANVLNLSNSGSTITLEQAELMLDFAASAPEATLLPTFEARADSAETPTLVALAPTPPTPPTPVALDALSERLESMLAFDAEVHKAMDDRRVDRQDMVRHIRYRFDEGLQVDIDADIDEVMKQRLAPEVARLEKRKMVVWKQNMAEEMRAEQERARHELRSVSALKRRPPREVHVAMKNLESLESLKHLEMLGYRALLSDSIKHEIKVSLEGALAALEHDLEAVMAGEEDAVEEQMEALEDFLEEVEDVLEEFVVEREAEDHQDGG